jgi:hypothetical protein
MHFLAGNYFNFGLISLRPREIEEGRDVNLSPISTGVLPVITISLGQQRGSLRVYGRVTGPLHPNLSVHILWGCFLTSAIPNDDSATSARKGTRRT